MRTSTSLAALAIVIIGFGFGHAGCYTSGIPGGSGAGGASAAAGTGGRDSTNPDSDAGDSEDASTAADSGATSNCDTVECDVDPGKPLCLPSTGACVECLIDANCETPTTGDAAVVSSSGTHHCVNNTCRTYTACDYPGKCTGGAGLCDQALERCVQCIETVDCSTPGTTCAGNLCRQVCSTANACPDSSPVCEKLGTSGICTERCVTDSDCALGYKCGSDKACTPAP